MSTSGVRTAYTDKATEQLYSGTKLHRWPARQPESENASRQPGTLLVLDLRHGTVRVLRR
jgi:hypothetical protein